MLLLFSSWASYQCVLLTYKNKVIELEAASKRQVIVCVFLSAFHAAVKFSSYSFFFLNEIQADFH